MTREVWPVAASMKRASVPASTRAAAARSSPAHADGGTTARRPPCVLGGVGELLALFDILRGDHPGQFAVGIDQRELFNAVLIKNAAGDDLVALLDTPAPSRRGPASRRP